jgi:hypothetical protein
VIRRRSTRRHLRLLLPMLVVGALATVVGVSGLGTATAATAAAGRVTSLQAAPAVSCTAASFSNLNLPNTTVNSVTSVAAAPPTPAYCAVKLTVNNPPSSDAVRVGVFLPDPWNGRFQGTGGGGYSGGNPDSPSLAALNAGYATAGTDTGHPGQGFVVPGDFALNADGTLNQQLINDFAFVGIHEMTTTAKAVIGAYYRQAPQYSYFNGCSTGGRQGLMEAQRYPTDYNGIASTSPAINWDRFMMAQLWGSLQQNLAGDFIPPCKFAAANAAAVAACDGLDGVTDGVIGAWHDCTFDAGTLVGTVTACGTITATDADIINKIWAGPNTSGKNYLWYGLLPGADIPPLNSAAGFIFSVNHIKYWLKQDPSFDWKTLSLDQYFDLFRQSVDEYRSVIGTDDPNLTAFRNNGGKIVGWVGTTDQLIYPQGSIQYYVDVKNRMGGLDKTRDFFRFFVAPGVNHCAGGVGATPVNTFEALVDWVENGNAPATLAGVRFATGATRPVCLYGEKAVYSGSGDVNSAATWSCQPDDQGFTESGPKPGRR